MDAGVRMSNPPEAKPSFHLTLFWLYGCSLTKLCPTLCDPMDCSPPGSFVHRISQAGILERIAISFSRGSSQPRNRTCISCTGRWVLYQWATCGTFFLPTAVMPCSVTVSWAVPQFHRPIITLRETKYTRHAVGIIQGVERSWALWKEAFSNHSFGQIWIRKINILQG